MRESAERDRSAPSPEGVAERALQLDWLAPDTVSLAALCRPRVSSLWAQIRHDPGAVLLLLRTSEDAGLGADGDACSLARRIRVRSISPDCLTESLYRLARTPIGFVDWDQPAVRDLYRCLLSTARWSQHLAQTTGQADANEAWACGLLAGLGWLAVAAVDPGAAASCCDDPSHAQQPLATQRCRWGLDHAAIARRLALRWRLPDTALALIGRLHLPIEAAQSLGCPPGLFHIVRLAAARAQQGGIDLGLVTPADAAESATTLGLNGANETLTPPRAESEAVAAGWQNPYQQSWLPAHLSLGAELRRIQNAAATERLEYELDVLHHVFEKPVEDSEDRLQSAKLSAMAEFAAGAGHEINNPLAVISGQAQYLLNHEAEWFCDEEQRPRRALTTIIGQTRRIHSLLRELMQFARPSPPRPSWIDLPTLLGEVAGAHGNLAEQRQVRVEVVTAVDRLPVCVDAEQTRLALSCLLRNALEAAPANGWARLRLAAPTDHWIDVAVEDSGPGPEPGQVSNLFDPFFSGRSAGRGRGLGLSVAWQLARLQQGELRLEPRSPDGPTRFLFRLPRVTSSPAPIERTPPPVPRQSPEAPAASGTCAA